MTPHLRLNLCQMRHKREMDFHLSVPLNSFVSTIIKDTSMTAGSSTLAPVSAISKRAF
jgi:hypothetical protein